MASSAPKRAKRSKDEKYGTQPMKISKKEVVKAYPGYNLASFGRIGMENKYFDTIKNSVVLTGSSAVGLAFDPTGGCLFFPQEGTGTQGTQRDGRKCLMTSVYIRGMLRISGTDITDPTRTYTPATAPTMWAALVVDKQTNGVQLLSEDVYNNPLGTANGIISMNRDMTQIQRFKVLKEWIIATRDYSAGLNIVEDGVNTNAWAPAQHYPFQCYLKLQIPVNFINNTNSVAAIADNSLHFLCGVTDNNSITQGQATVQYTCRVQFKDL